MNDKDKEAFKKYSIKYNLEERYIWNELSLDEIWQAACEYKQKEIGELKLEIMRIKAERNKTQKALKVAKEKR